MVYLNKNVFVDIKKLEINLLKIIEDKVVNELDYVHNINDKKKERVKSNIIKEIKNEIRKDYFLYRIMASDRCVYKHKYGKNDGKFCCKRITANGDKNQYVCTLHNRNHIPQKKEINTSNNNILISKSIHLIDNNKLINESIKDIPYKCNKVISSEDTSSISNLNQINKYKKNYIIKNKMKRINLYVNKFNLDGFKKSIKYDDQYNYSENIICRYKSCNNKSCLFKHVDNNIPLNEFINFSIQKISTY